MRILIDYSVLPVRATVALLLFLVPPASGDDYDAGPPDTLVLANDCTGMPRLCADDLGHVYVGTEICTEQCVIVRSIDRGRTWESPVLIEQLSGSASFASQVSRLACDNLGNVYALWPNGQVNLFINVSHDFGVTWKQDPIRLNTHEPSTSPLHNCDLAHDGNGNIYVVWPEEGGGRALGVYFNVSRDFGDTWLSSDIRLNQDLSDPAGLPRVAADDLGHVYVLMLKNVSGELKQFFTKSDDFGATFSPEVDIAPDRMEAFTGRMAADNSGNVVIAAIEGGIGGELFVNVSSDYGTTFLSQTIPVSTSVEVVDIVTDCVGTVSLGYLDIRDPNTRFFFNRSFDHGLTWEPQDVELTTANPFVQDEGFVATRSGHLYAAWSGTGVYLNVSCDQGTTWSGPMRIDQPSNSGDVTVAADNLGNSYVAWDVINPRAVRLNWASPSVGLGISGPTDPVRVPPEGRTFDYEVFASNNTSSPIQNLMFSLDVTKPDGATTPPFIGPVTATLNPFFQRQKTLRLRIPERLPAGEYLISLRVDGPVTDQNHMCVIKD